MKEYKINLSGFEGKVREVVNEAIQCHAFELGYPGWLYGGKIVQDTQVKFLYIKEDCFTIGFNADTHLEAPYTPISAADFLALSPEDVQDEEIVTTEPAEWLLVTGSESLTLVPNGTRVVKIKGSGVLSVEPFTRTVAERFLPKEGK